MKTMETLVSKTSMLLLMLISVFYTNQVWAKFANAGMYINASTAKFGQNINLRGVVKSDAIQNGVTVTIGLHRVADNGSVAAEATFSKAFPNQNFVAEQRIVYDAPYLIPSTILTGNYRMVLKVGTAPGLNEYLYSTGTAPSWNVFIEGVGPITGVTFTNTGVWIPTSTVNAGASIEIQNGLKASKNVANLNLKFEIRKVLASGEISSPAIATQEIMGASLIANEPKAFKNIFLIPPTTESGKYIISLFAFDPLNNNQVFAFNEVNDINSFTIIGSDPNVTFQLAGVHIPVKTVEAGSPIAINSSYKSSGNISFTTVRMEVRKVSDSGQIASTPTASVEMKDQSFVGGVSSLYKPIFQIPENATAGRYILSTFIMSGSGKPLFTYNTVASINTFTVTTAAVATPFLRGINIMDMGISKEVIPGVYNTNYTRPTLQSLKALKERGMQVVRLPFLWERVQPTLGGALDSAYMGHIIQMLKDTKTAGLVAILDMHNYARYMRDGVWHRFGESTGPTKVQYADAWKKIAAAVKANADAYSALYAYDIMNEPYDLPTNTGINPEKIWEEYAQVAVDAIRSNNDDMLIHVEGYSYSAPHRWKQYHPKPFITDKYNNLMYHAHLYMDWDTSGKYKKSYDEEQAIARSKGYASVGALGIANLKVFADWCEQYNQRCFLGEFGWPNAHHGGAENARKWNLAGEEFMDYMDSIRIGGTMWSTGSWLLEADNVMNTYILPNPSRSLTPLSQSEVLERHMGEQ